MSNCLAFRFLVASSLWFLELNHFKLNAYLFDKSQCCNLVKYQCYLFTANDAHDLILFQKTTKRSCKGRKSYPLVSGMCRLGRTWGAQCSQYCQICKKVGQNVSHAVRELATVFPVPFFMVTICWSSPPPQRKVSRHVTGWCPKSLAQWRSKCQKALIRRRPQSILKWRLISCD